MVEKNIQELLRLMKVDLMRGQSTVQYVLHHEDRTISHIARLEEELAKSPDDILAEEVEAKLGQQPAVQYARELTKREITMMKKREAKQSAQFEKEWNDVVAEASRREPDAADDS